LGRPEGGTELSGAVNKLLAAGVRDILVLTDGQTWAHEVEELKSKEARISAILVGDDSLDANIGHLCAMTGGQVFYAPGEDITKAVTSSLTSLRSGSGSISGNLTVGLPESIQVTRASVDVSATWQSATANIPADAIGRYAASLALPILPAHSAQDFAEAHCLCSHMTSLVLVDEAGEATDMLPEMRKVPLMASENIKFGIMASAPRPPSPQSVSYCMESDFDEVSGSSSSSPSMRSKPTRLMKKIKSLTGKRKNNAEGNSSRARNEEHNSSEASAYEPDRGYPSFISKLTDKISENADNDPLEFAKEIDWDLYSNKFLTNKISDLSRGKQRFIRTLAENSIIREIAEELSAARPVIALALLAKLVEEDNRGAKRFAQRILGNLGEERLKHAMSCVQPVPEM
jgi:hypothetical protein